MIEARVAGVRSLATEMRLWLLVLPFTCSSGASLAQIAWVCGDPSADGQTGVCPNAAWVESTAPAQDDLVGVCVSPNCQAGAQFSDWSWIQWMPWMAVFADDIVAGWDNIDLDDLYLAETFGAPPDEPPPYTPLLEILADFLIHYDVLILDGDRWYVRFDNGEGQRDCRWFDRTVLTQRMDQIEAGTLTLMDALLEVFANTTFTQADYDICYPPP